MQTRNLTVTVLAAYLVIFLISNMSELYAYADKQTQDNGTKKIFIVNCQWSGTCFSPCQTIVVKGDTVTWINLSNSIHMIASGSAHSGPDGWFGSSFIAPHGTFSYKFDRVYPFAYFDILHSKSEGVVIVGYAVDSSQARLMQTYFSDWCRR